jgi:hypothetical protein
MKNIKKYLFYLDNIYLNNAKIIAMANSSFKERFEGSYLYFHEYK